jgi:pimeloyl-ACP methyl ester carboxylesterase
MLEVRVSGPSAGMPVVFHHGTPGTLPPRVLAAAVHARGMRLVTFARAGYAGSTRRPGRAVVDVVDDTAAVLRSIGADRSLVMGWSGGGPHALACAAGLPGVIRALTVAGLAPADAAGLDFVDGMSRDNREEWDAVFAGEAKLRTLVESVAPLLTATPDQGGDPDDSLPASDWAAIVGDFAEDLTAANRDGLRFGIDGWIDDELAFAKPWGFELGQIEIPVSVWHGTEDMNVPVAHGRWLASNLPHASLHLERGAGHMSIVANAIDRIVADLADAVES